jgi:putative MATE family efflux protein
MLIDATDRTPSRLVWGLALPVLGEQLLTMFVGWSDTILTGQILQHETYLSAITVCGYLLWLLESIAAVITAGAQAIVARRIGAGDSADANRVTQQSLVLSVILGGLMLGGVVVGAGHVVAWLRLTQAAQLLAVQYLWIVAASCPFLVLMLSATTCLRAAGHTLAGMWIVAAVNVINVACSWTLALGAGPLPQMGWRGIALGTALSFVAGGMLGLGLLWRGYGALRLPRKFPRPDGKAFRQILRIGIPGSANAVTVVLCHLWFVAIIGRLGDAAVAAHGVAIRCESISWLSAEAFAVAAATLVGQSLGALRPQAARQFGWTALRLGIVSLSLMGFGFFFGARWLFAIFVPAEQTGVLDQGVPVLRLVAFGMPGLAASIILTGALRGAGDTRRPLLYNTAGLLLVRIPVAFLLTSDAFGLGLYGAWIALVLDVTIRGIAAGWCFLASGWTRIHV